MGIVALVALGCAAAAWVLVLLVDRARDRTRFASIREAMGPPLAQRGATGLVGTVEGRLAADAPRLTSFHPTGTSFLDELNAYAATYRPPESAVRIDLGDGHHAVVEGDLQVLSGTVESEHGASLDAAPTFHAEPLADRDGPVSRPPALRTRRGQFRQLSPGDLVRVRGALAPAPDDDALYRAGSHVVRVGPVPGAVVSAVWMAAASPPVRRRTRRSRAALAASLAAFCAGGGAALVFVSQRDAARPIATGASDARGAAAAPDCRARVVDRLEHDDAAAATQLLASCSDPYAHGVEAFARGDFDQASARFAEASRANPDLVPSLMETEAHVFAHQRPLAAAAARRMVDHFYPGPNTAEKRYLECVAGLVGDQPPRLDDKGSPRTRNALHPATCSDRPFSKFAHGIDGPPSVDLDTDSFDAGYDAVGAPYTAVVGTRARLFARPVGVERDLLDRYLLAPGPTHPPPDGALAASDDYGLMGYGRIGYFWWTVGPEIWVRTAAFAAELALYYAYAGLPERATPYWPILDRLADTRETTPTKAFHEIDTFLGPEWAKHDRWKIADEDRFILYIMSVGAGAALLAGDEARTKRYAGHGEVYSVAVLEQVERMLHGAPWEEPLAERHWRDRQELFAAAGDGAEVARVLTANQITGAEALPRVLPRLRTNRAALDAWFTERFPSACLTCGAATYFGHIADRRAIARLLGAKAEADRLAPVVTRFVDAQTDPRVAWEIDELETFFARPH